MHANVSKLLCLVDGVRFGNVAYPLRYLRMSVRVTIISSLATCCVFGRAYIMLIAYSGNILTVCGRPASSPLSANLFRFQAT